MNDVLNRAVSAYGIDAQTDMTIEEMSELAKALLKYRRYKTELRREAILEEMADVEIMLKQMEIIYGDPSEWREKKLARLETRLLTVKEDEK